MSCSDDETIIIWSLETYELLGTLTDHRGPVVSLLHIQNTKLILSGSDDKTIKIWNY